MIRVTAEPFDAGREATAFQASHIEAGAMVTFTGLVRSLPGDPILALILECYEELAVNELSALREQAIARFGLVDAAIIHRHGRLVPGETIMMVMTLAAHRQAAFDGAQFLMDYLKNDAPFWKQEETPTGTRWVVTMSKDRDAQNRWIG
ncbi:MAG: molybdenum cofactor biosynthesis protein MoaE [Phyllobacteriaceae bacterium]|nr:molybdenum cofactor biosynthesis protein MoaE [Phyllobacteriaceae bacterium]